MTAAPGGVPARPSGRRGETLAAVRNLRSVDGGSLDTALARSIADVLIEGFDRHYGLFRTTSASAKERFERAAWAGAQRAAQERIQFYDLRVAECVDRLRSEFDLEAFEAPLWRQVKLFYIGLLVEHHQPELAETFFNSVITRILRRTYAQNDLIFVRATMATDDIESDPPVYRSYYPAGDGLRECIGRIFRDFEWAVAFADLDRDVDRVVRELDERTRATSMHIESNHQIQVLGSPFYRNKAAYVLGKIVNGDQEQPFVVPVLHDDSGRLALDAVLLDEEQLNVLFSLSRAYFMVDMDVPASYVEFLRTMAPSRQRADLYTMLGLGKQGKTLFFRDLLQHLHHSDDEFVEAPGIKGQVMLVFTLPSYPFVFKVIKDVFGFGKETTRAKVREKFTMVKHVDRVGRMADTLEFTELALPRERFSAALLDELQRLAPSMIELGESLVIRHCYVERRMVPLNIHLERATPDELDAAVIEYGNAVRDLAIANIFPGDMLWRNFGVNRHGRVVFYDYDEIEYLSDCNFRRIPPAPSSDDELADGAWYGVLPHDVFPEEFATFLLGDARLRQPFLRHNADLLEPEFWQACQRRLEDGNIADFFPYPESVRFRGAPSS
jgi:isocitrate dehydrogenase kinase/phosphatase